MLTVACMSTENICHPLIEKVVIVNYSDFSGQFFTFSLNKPNRKHKEVTNTTTDKATEEWLNAQKKTTGRPTNLIGGIFCDSRG